MTLCHLVPRYIVASHPPDLFLLFNQLVCVTRHISAACVYAHLKSKQTSVVVVISIRRMHPDVQHAMIHKCLHISPARCLSTLIVL